MIIGTTLIVLCWALFHPMGMWLWAAILLTVLGACLILFGLLFFVYFFNLDGKMLAALRPLLEKVYDHRKRNKRI